MSGERDLGALLRGLAPILDDTRYAFGTVPRGQAPAYPLQLLGKFEEEEGTTLIAPAVDLALAGVEHSAAMAKISLKMHSSLEAVGLTAAISAVLAGAGISANVVAGYFHDHVFVPWERREDAMAVLRRLSAGGTPL